MNQKNVEALALILRELRLGMEEGDLGVPELEMEACRYSAELLASRGVLVPSALTETDAICLEHAVEDANDEAHQSYSQVTDAQLRAAIVAELEKVARGQP